MKITNVIIFGVSFLMVLMGTGRDGVKFSLANQDDAKRVQFSSQNDPMPEMIQTIGKYSQVTFEKVAPARDVSTRWFDHLPHIASGTTFVSLIPGECYTDTMVCSVPDFPPVADILFDFDLTGSMGQELDRLKANSINIMAAIQAEIPNSNFGLISAEDYNHDYFDLMTNCDYVAPYGSDIKPDSPYRLDISLTSDITAVSMAINAMVLGDGMDPPEDYTRQLYESVAELVGDTNSTYGTLGWRPESKKIVLAFNDNLPHDCNVTQCLGAIPWSFGKDPGRDEIPNTGDDLVLLEVLDEMASQNISLVDVCSADSLIIILWHCLASRTPGGGAFLVNPDGSIPGGVSIDSFIVSLIEATFDTLEEVSPRVCGGDPSFLNSVTPSSYFDVYTPSDLTFELEFCVPPGTNPGTYCIDVCTYTDDNLLLCTYTICIEVTSGVGVEEEPESENLLSEGFQLLESTPNPFQSTTQIRYVLPGVGGDIPVRLDVFDITGSLVEVLVNETQGPGAYEVEWDGREAGSGIYFYRLTAGRLDALSSFIETKKFVLMR
jgi:hypothetical protein